jgi:hypothetical protein
MRSIVTSSFIFIIFPILLPIFQAQGQESDNFQLILDKCSPFSQRSHERITIVFAAAGSKPVSMSCAYAFTFMKSFCTISALLANPPPGGGVEPQPISPQMQQDCSDTRYQNWLIYIDGSPQFSQALHQMENVTNTTSPNVTAYNQQPNYSNPDGTPSGFAPVQPHYNSNVTLP